MRGKVRTIKPELLSDEQLGDLERETHLPIFRAFVGLLVFADREGRFRWAPRALRGAIAPCWEGDFEECLEALAGRSLVIRYTVNGEDFGFIRSFKKHQTIHPNETRSVLPPPDSHGSVVFPGIPGSPSQASESAVENSATLRGRLTHPNLTQSRSLRSDPDARATDGATALHRERKPPPSGSRPARVYTMPSEEPPAEYLDDALLAGVSREQAVSTWTHYWTAGLPEKGVEKLVPFLIKSAKERANAIAKVSRGKRTEPDDRLQQQADRVQMLREQEQQEEQLARAGVNS